MGCNDIQALFSEYIDETLAEYVREEVATHLRECPACAAELESFAQLINELQSLPEPTLPPGFHQGLVSYVRKAVQKDAKHKKRRQFVVYRRAAFSSMVASLLLVFLWFSGALTPDIIPQRMVTDAPVQASPAAGIVPEAAADVGGVAAEFYSWSIPGEFSEEFSEEFPEEFPHRRGIYSGEALAEGFWIYENVQPQDFAFAVQFDYIPLDEHTFMIYVPRNAFAERLFSLRQTIAIPLVLLALGAVSAAFAVILTLKLKKERD